MSKVQGKDGGILSNLSGTGITDELESRLRDLERNIAVAREFIKLADESYSELRHEWNLLQQDALGKPGTNITGTTIPTKATRERGHSGERSQTKKNTKPEADDVTGKVLGEPSAKTSRQRRTKTTRPSEDDHEFPVEKTVSPSPNGPPRGSRTKPKR